jgi:hypothetical protein
MRPPGAVLPACCASLLGWPAGVPPATPVAPASPPDLLSPHPRPPTPLSPHLHPPPSNPPQPHDAGQHLGLDRWVSARARAGTARSRLSGLTPSSAAQTQPLGPQACCWVADACGMSRCAAARRRGVLVAAGRGVPGHPAALDHGAVGGVPHGWVGVNYGVKLGVSLGPGVKLGVNLNLSPGVNVGMYTTMCLMHVVGWWWCVGVTPHLHWHDRRRDDVRHAVLRCTGGQLRHRNHAPHQCSHR